MISRPISAASPSAWACWYSSVSIMASTASRWYCSFAFSSSACQAPMARLASSMAPLFSQSIWAWMPSFRFSL